MLAVLIGKVKSFSKEIYQNAMAKLDLHSLACSCGHAGCLTVHGYYTRKVRDQNGFFLVNIMRVKCKECGRTHALLPEALVPYSQIPVDIQRDIEVITWPTKNGNNGL